MFIHDTSCISAQQTFGEIDLENLRVSENNQLIAVEPADTNIPLRILRRMGKAVRIAVVAATPLMERNPNLRGITIGTANGGFEDCIKFLNQVVEYEEGILTPTNFVQSTPNGITSQVGMISKNLGHNNTHVHKGLSFEMAMLDAMMLLKENPESKYLLGGVDEISPSNYNIEEKDGWHKSSSCTNLNLYSDPSEGSITGEGAALFVVGADKNGALAEITGLKAIHSTEPEVIIGHLQEILATHQPDLLISGENGDPRFLPYFEAVEKELPGIPVVRFKHLFGEYTTVSAAALWLAVQTLNNHLLPAHAIKSGEVHDAPKQMFKPYNRNARQFLFHGLKIG